jgi:hypothetical protein
VRFELVLLKRFNDGCAWSRGYASDDPNFAFGPDVPGEKCGSCRHSRQLEGSKFAVIKARNKLFDDLADSDDEVRSRIDLYESGVRLVPAHSNHSDVGNLGRGRFSHSTTMFSDNTDL